MQRGQSNFYFRGTANIEFNWNTSERHVTPRINMDWAYGAAMLDVLKFVLYTNITFITGIR